MVTYGAMSREPMAVPASNFIFKNLHCHGFWVSHWHQTHESERKIMLNEILGWIRGGQFVDLPVEITTLSLDQSERDWFSHFKTALEASQAGGGLKQVILHKYED